MVTDIIEALSCLGGTFTRDEITKCLATKGLWVKDLDTLIDLLLDAQIIIAANNYMFSLSNSR